MFFQKSSSQKVPIPSLDESEPTTKPEPVPITSDADGHAAQEELVYPSGLKLGLLLASIFISVFLVALVSISIPDLKV